MATEYDVAISFAGEDRAYAERLADFLVNEFELLVFYDDYEQAKLWGSSLPERLFDIYRNKARYCVVLISAAYKAKRWTQHEWRSAQERALLEPESQYILSVRLDDTTLDGIFETIACRDGRGGDARKIARLVFEKAGDFSKLAAIVRLADQKYREGLAEQALALISDKKFDQDIDALRTRGNAFGKLSRYAEAVKAFDAIIQQRPRDFLSHFHVGIFSFRLSDFARAVHHYEIADELSPGHPTIETDLPRASVLLAQSGGTVPSALDVPLTDAVEHFVALIESGAVLQAIEAFYSRDVVVQYNLQLELTRRDEVIRHARASGALVRWARASTLRPVFIDGDRVVIRWSVEYQRVDGLCVAADALAYQRWSGGRIVHERFFYDPTALPPRVQPGSLKRRPR